MLFSADFGDPGILDSVISSLPSWESIPKIPGSQTAEEVQKTAQTAQKTFEKIGQFFDDPSPFFEKALQGTLKGYEGKDNAEKMPDGAPEGTLSLKVTQLLMGSFSTTSANVIKHLLENSETYDLDEVDKDLKATAIATLTANQNAKKSLPETVKSVWETLNKYHIIVGGITVNFKPSSDKKMREKRVNSEGSNNDGVSPIHSLVRCQEAWRNLRTQNALHEAIPSPVIPSAHPHKRILSAEELAQIDGLVAKTDKIVSNFSQKTIHYTTMYIIHHICNHSFDPALYLKIIEEGGDIEARYLKKFSGPVREFLYKVGFRTISWFIRPLIGETIEQMVIHVRKFLNSDVDLLQLVQKKIGNMADYYGRIEKARRDYNQPNRSDECGTFDNFLIETIKVYGSQKLTEGKLIHIFGNYIVDNFVPRPTIKLFGHRIPLISSFLEWVGHTIRKTTVRYVMNKFGIVKKMLTQGTDSVHYAQLGLKRLLEQKLSQVCEMVARSRTRSVVQIDPLLGGPSNSTPVNLEAKKAQLISRQLHLMIQQHSSKLLRFIDIESCNGDERQLADLDNRVSALFSELMSVINTVYKGASFSLRQVLEDASTNAMETALLGLFEDKEKQIEENLQTIFDVLDKSYSYVPDEERAERGRKYLEECDQVDQNLSTLQEQLTRAAVSAALELHLKNVSGEKHHMIKDYVSTEKELHENFVGELASLAAKLHIPNIEDQKSEPLKDVVSQIVTLIEQYLSHISAQLPSSELESCYSDVKGDLHNIYAATIVHLNLLHEKMNQIATAVNTIKTTEVEIGATNLCKTMLDRFWLNTPLQEAIESCAAIQSQLPSSIREELNPKLETLIGDREALENTTVELATFDQAAKLKEELRVLIKNKQMYNKALEILNSLKELSLEYHNLNGPNKKYTTKKAVDERLDYLYKAIQKEWGRLRGFHKKNDDFKNEIFVHLNAKSTSELYALFFPSFWARKVPVFSNLAALQDKTEQEIQENRAKLANLPETPKLREEITERQEFLRQKILQNVKSISTSLQKNWITQSLRGDELKTSINMIQSEAFGKENMIALSELAKHFTVKGCISVGEIKLYNRLAPELTAHIAPKIVQGFRTVIDAMGKPFHYKQMVLRLLFLEIAEREEAA